MASRYSTGMLSVDDHPSLCARAFTSAFPGALGEQATSTEISALLAGAGGAPIERSEELRKAVRDVLRHGGHKPTGRGKPSCEYLVRAVGEGALSSINLAVDACNAASYSSGLPISVVDLDLVREPLHIGIAGPDSSYVFNPSGQEIRLDGLLCLFDAEGPCANAVKDCQRTKTHAGTRRTLSVVWGARAFEEHTDQAARWYRELLERAGAQTEVVL